MTRKRSRRPPSRKPPAAAAWKGKGSSSGAAPKTSGGAAKPKSAPKAAGAPASSGSATSSTAAGGTKRPGLFTRLAVSAQTAGMGGSKKRADEATTKGGTDRRGRTPAEAPAFPPAGVSLARGLTAAGRSPGVLALTFLVVFGIWAVVQSLGVSLAALPSYLSQVGGLPPFSSFLLVQLLQAGLRLRGWVAAVAGTGIVLARAVVLATWAVTLVARLRRDAPELAAGADDPVETVRVRDVLRILPGVIAFEVGFLLVALVGYTIIPGLGPGIGQLGLIAILVATMYFFIFIPLALVTEGRSEDGHPGLHPGRPAARLTAPAVHHRIPDALDLPVAGHPGLGRGRRHAIARRVGLRAVCLVRLRDGLRGLRVPLAHGPGPGPGRAGREGRVERLRPAPDLPYRRRRVLTGVLTCSDTLGPGSEALPRATTHVRGPEPPGSHVARDAGRGGDDPGGGAKTGRRKHMPVATRRELLEAGVHFGHQTRRWNPKMQRFIFGERSGIYIIDLEKTLDGLHEAHDFLMELGRTNGIVLFVGTKKQAQETVAEQAGRVGMPFVNHRWLGGMLTNFQTMHGRLKRLRELRDMERSGAFEFLPKKEVLRLRHEKEKLERNLAGIQDMERLPEAVFILDTKKRAHRHQGGPQAGHPGGGHRRHELRPGRGRLRDPRQRRRHPGLRPGDPVVADALQEGQYLAYQGMQARSRAQPEFEHEPGATTFGAEDGEQRRTRLSDEEAAWMGEAVGEGGPGSGETGEQAGEPAPASSAGEPASEVAVTEPEAATEETDTADVVPEPVEPEPAEPEPAEPEPAQAAEAEPVDAPPAESAGDEDGSTVGGDAAPEEASDAPVGPEPAAAEPAPETAVEAG